MPPTITHDADGPILQPNGLDWIEEIQEYLATLAPVEPTAPQPGITLPPLADLLAQAGITPGPAPADPRKPGPLRRALRTLAPARPTTPSTARQLPSDTLTEAVTLLAGEGWAQGARSTETGRCVRGAFDHLVTTGRTDRATADRALAWLVADLRESVPSWNDRAGRRRAEVLAALREAAARARAAGE